MIMRVAADVPAGPTPGGPAVRSTDKSLTWEKAPPTGLEPVTTRFKIKTSGHWWVIVDNADDLGLRARLGGGRLGPAVVVRDG